jgi:hypothetical protein
MINIAKIILSVGISFAFFSCGNAERKRAQLRGGDTNPPVTEQEFKSCAANDIKFEKVFTSNVYYCARQHNGLAYDYCTDTMMFKQNDCTFRLRTVSYQTQATNTAGIVERDVTGQWLINAENSKISLKDSATRPQKLNFKILETEIKENKTYLKSFEIATIDQSKVWVFKIQAQP